MECTIVQFHNLIITPFCEGKYNTKLNNKILYTTVLFLFFRYRKLDPKTRSPVNGYPKDSSPSWIGGLCGTAPKWDIPQHYKIMWMFYMNGMSPSLHYSITRHWVLYQHLTPSQMVVLPLTCFQNWTLLSMLVLSLHLSKRQTYSSGDCFFLL